LGVAELTALSTETSSCIKNIIKIIGCGWTYCAQYRDK